MTLVNMFCLAIGFAAGVLVMFLTVAIVKGREDKSDEASKKKTL